MALSNNRMIFKVQGSSVESQQLELNAGESGLLAAMGQRCAVFLWMYVGGCASMCKLGMSRLTSVEKGGSLGPRGPGIEGNPCGGGQGS